MRLNATGCSGSAIHDPGAVDRCLGANQRRAPPIPAVWVARRRPAPHGSRARFRPQIRSGLTAPGRWRMTLRWPRRSGTVPHRSDVVQARPEVEDEKIEPAQPEPTQPEPAQPKPASNRWLPPGMASASNDFSAAASPVEVSPSNGTTSPVDLPPSDAEPADLIRGDADAVTGFSPPNAQSAPAQFGRRIGARFAGLGGRTTIRWPPDPAPEPPPSPAESVTATWTPVDMPVPLAETSETTATTAMPATASSFGPALDPRATERVEPEPVQSRWLPTTSAQSPEPSPAQPPVAEPPIRILPSAWHSLVELIRAGDPDAAAGFYEARMQKVREAIARRRAGGS